MKAESQLIVSHQVIVFHLIYDPKICKCKIICIAKKFHCMSVLFSQYLEDEERCFCQEENGEYPYNGIICGKSNRFAVTSHCASDATCSGGHRLDYAVKAANHSQLCSKGIPYIFGSGRAY